MKKYLPFLLLLLLPAAVRAQDAFRIDEVGIAGYFDAEIPTPVRIHIPAQPRSQSIQLQFRFQTSASEEGPLTDASDYFSKQVQVTAGSPLDIEVPLSAPNAKRSALQMIANDDNGRKIGEAYRNLGLDSSHNGVQSLILAYCTDEIRCRDIQSQSFYTSFDRNGAKNIIRVKVAFIQQPREHWWAYGKAGSLILASPVSDFTKNQQESIEMFLRAGGTVVLLEKEIADPGLLAAYRHGPPVSQFVIVGGGTLVRIPTLANDSLTKYFTAESGKLADINASTTDNNSLADVLLDRLGMSFRFPRLRWLIIWLSIYILVVGPANFILLKRLGKLEWGWITTLGISVLFAAALYFGSAAGRPAAFFLDNIAVYWMDGQSPRATSHYALRLTSPERRSISLSMNDDVLLPKSGVFQSNAAAAVHFGSDVTDKQSIDSGLEIRLGPPLLFDFPVLRWSYQDFDFDGQSVFPGSVHWISPMHLKNDTGKDFSQALYLDRSANKQYFIPHMAAGEEVDLSGVVPTPIWTFTKEGGNIPAPDKYRIHDAAFPRPMTAEKVPFSVEEVPYMKAALPPGGNIFIGLTDGPAASTQFDVPIINRSTALIEVSVGDK